jgi:hypothetical protein
MSTTPGTVQIQSNPPINIGSLASAYPTYALRAWLTALLAQTQQTQMEAEATLAGREVEIKHLKEQIDRSQAVVKSLQDAIDRVDSVLRRKRDVQINRDLETQPNRETERQPATGLQEASPTHEQPRAETEASEQSSQTQGRRRGTKHE